MTNVPDASLSHRNRRQCHKNQQLHSLNPCSVISTSSEWCTLRSTSVAGGFLTMDSLRLWFLISLKPTDYSTKQQPHKLDCRHTIYFKFLKYTHSFCSCFKGTYTHKQTTQSAGSLHPESISVKEGFCDGKTEVQYTQNNNRQ